MYAWDEPVKDHAIACQISSDKGVKKQIMKIEAKVCEWVWLT